MTDSLATGTDTTTPPSDSAPVTPPSGDAAAVIPAVVAPVVDGETPPADTPAIEYEAFVLPDGIEMDQAALERAVPVLKSMGLPQDKAQSLVDLYASELQAGIAAALTPERMAEYEQQVVADRATRWAEDVKADKEIGGANLDQTHKLIEKGIRAFGTPELAKALNDTGLGNHPELVRLFRKIGMSTGEDQSGLPPAGGGAEIPFEQRMYPNKK